MKFHEMRQEDIEQSLNTNYQEGLSTEEVAIRRKQFGYNQLEEAEKQSALLLFSVSQGLYGSCVIGSHAHFRFTR